MYSLALVVCAVALSHCSLAGKVCSRPPQVLFATIDVDKSVYEVGEEVEYTCRPGFVPNNGQRKYTCLPTGKWPLNTLLCLPVTCAPPSLPEFSVLSYRRSKPGNVSHFLDTITFECVPPLALIGNETATCMANGNWSSIPECKVVTCPTPTGIENGFLEFVVRRTYHYNESVSFGCQPSYVLEGPKHSRCENTGNWSTKPTCKGPCKIPVKKAVVLYNGEKKRVQNDLKDGVQHGETVSFFCKNKEKSCAYTVPVPCVDGNLTLPACFKERGFFSTLVKKDPSDMKPCEDQE
ncbi:beta-2-glycoprotein 1 isoform X2 [Pezoporus occidentalis]|uniref:beta-2-glycoprotein 1 isoform X2 n=1 Tax=Pezoporus flaviventris TaxID=889875 RepID=UPI002AB2F2D1|nr:beta-2-glycoprotein 1 isoform X2 [Pezoporus flaviventris]